MRRIQRIILASLAFWTYVQAHAAVYYVDTVGSDSNPGTALQPWRTIQFAANTAGAGDTVIVQQGLYPERVTPKKNGTAAARITFRSNSATNYGFYINRSYVTIDGFDVIGNTNTPNWEGAIEVYRGNDSVWLVNNHIHDFDAINTRIYGIHFYYASNAVVAAANCIISNNVFRNTSYLMLSLNCSNALVTRNVFDFANTHDAIHCFGGNITISENLFTNMSKNPLVADHTDIIQTFGDEPVDAYDVVFERNTIINCEAQLCQLEQKGRANIRDWTFRNNLWVNVGMGGNVDIENCRWHNNTFYRCTTNTAGPILLNCNPKGCANGAEIVNNIFVECGSNPASKDIGWYHPENTNFTFFADFNFVCGANGAAKGKKFVESNGINGGNPWFVAPLQNDFRPRSVSPLLNRGTTIVGFQEDIIGTVRPVAGAWDIGAYEAMPVSSALPSAPQNLRATP